MVFKYIWWLLTLTEHLFNTKLKHPHSQLFRLEPHEGPQSTDFADFDFQAS